MKRRKRNRETGMKRRKRNREEWNEEKEEKQRVE